MARNHGLGLFLAIIFALRGSPALADDFTPLNTSPTTAKVDKIEVLTRVAPRSTVATYQGQGLALRLRTLANTPAPSLEIEFNGARLFLVDLSFESYSAVPSELEHRINLRGAGSPAHEPG